MAKRTKKDVNPVAENRTVSIEDISGMVTVANDFALDLEKGKDSV